MISSNLFSYENGAIVEDHKIEINPEWEALIEPLTPEQIAAFETRPSQAPIEVFAYRGKLLIIDGRLRFAAAIRARGHITHMVVDCNTPEMAKHLFIKRHKGRIKIS